MAKCTAHIRVDADSNPAPVKFDTCKLHEYNGIRPIMAVGRIWPLDLYGGVIMVSLIRRMDNKPIGYVKTFSDLIDFTRYNFGGSLSLEEAIQNFIDDFFFSFPESPKPPVASKLIYKDIENGDLPGPDAEVEAFEIQMAVAGFGKDDIKVSHDDRVLTIKGSNEKNKGITGKLSCSFEKKFAVNDRMDLTNVKVRLKDGLLSVKIPIKEPELKVKVIDVEAE